MILIIIKKIIRNWKIVLFVCNFYLAKSNHTLLGSNATSLDHDEIIVDFTVMRESSHGGDGFFSKIVFGGSVVFDDLQNKKNEHENQSQIKYK